jgi:methyltransferase of ATP-grasp peptide maturase system
MMNDRVPGLLASLAAELERAGALRSAEWRAALLAVPRHVFLPRFYIDEIGPHGVTVFRPVSADSSEDDWLALTYEDRTLATQLDGSTTPPACGAPVEGVPTSSSTRPSTVVRMLEDLEVFPGARVLELGTGTGYSTALLCERLGSDHVTSVEYDAELSNVAGERLASLGYHPHLVVGDGAQGHPDGAPYDRVIAAYSPSRVPPAWIEQAADDALILVSIVGDLDVYAYTRLRKVGPDRATGRLVDADVSFMRTRTVTRRPAQLRAAMAARAHAEPVTPRMDVSLLIDQDYLWAAQLALPGVRRLWVGDDHWFLHPDGSWAVLEAGDDPRAYEGGERRLWTELEDVATRWSEAGRPDRERYGVTADRSATVVWLDEPDNQVGVLS